MPSGALMEIITNYSGENVWLNGDPQVTFFKILFKRHTPFYSESIPISFNTVPAFSKTLVATFGRSGDLLGQIYICLNLPRVDLSYHPDTLLEICNYIKSFNLDPNDPLLQFIQPVQLHEILLCLETANQHKSIIMQPNPISYNYTFNVTPSLEIYNSLIDNLFFETLINNSDIIDTIRIKNSLQNNISFNLNNSNIGKYINNLSEHPFRQNLYPLLSDFNFSFNYNLSLINSVNSAFDRLFRTVPLIYVKPFRFDSPQSSGIIYNATNYYNLSNNYSTIFDSNVANFFYISTKNYPIELSEYSPFTYTSLQDVKNDNAYISYFNSQADIYFNIVNYQIERTFSVFADIFTTTSNLFYNKSPKISDIFNLKVVNNYFKYQKNERISNILNISLWYFYYFSYIIYEFRIDHYRQYLLSNGYSKENADYVYYTITLLKYNLSSLMDKISSIVNNIYSNSFSYYDSDSLINYSISTFNQIIDNVNINTEFIGVTFILHRNQIPSINEIADYLFSTIKSINLKVIENVLNRHVDNSDNINYDLANNLIYDYFAALFNLTKQSFNEMGFSETVTLYPIYNDIVVRYWSTYLVNKQTILNQMKFYHIIEQINENQTNNFYFNVLLNKKNLENIMGNDLINYISELLKNPIFSKLDGFYYLQNTPVRTNIEESLNNLQFSAFYENILDDPDLRKTLYRKIQVTAYNTTDISNYNFYRLDNTLYKYTNYSLDNIDDFEIALYGCLSIVMNKLSQINLDLARSKLLDNVSALPTTYVFDLMTANNLYRYVYYLLKTLDLTSVFKNNKGTFDFKTKPVTYSWVLRTFFGELESFICNKSDMSITLLSELYLCLNEMYCNYYNGIQIKAGAQQFQTDIATLIIANRTDNDSNIYRSLLNYRNKYVTQYIWYFLNQRIICSLFAQYNSIKFSNLRIFELITNVFYYLDRKIITYPYTGYTDSDVINYYTKKYVTFSKLEQLVFDYITNILCRQDKSCNITTKDYEDYNILNNRFDKTTRQYNEKYTEIKNGLASILHRGKKARSAWIRKLGIYLVKTVELYNQDQLLYKTNSQMMDIYYTNNLDIGKKYGFDKMIANLPEVYEYNSLEKESREIVIPLFFSCCLNPEQTIPIVASLTEYRIKIELRDLKDVFYTDGIIEDLKLDGGYLMAEYYYIGSEEREIFAKKKLEYLITEYEYDVEYAKAESINKHITIKNDFPNLATNYYFAIQPSIHINLDSRNICSNYFPGEKQYSNFSLLPLYNLDKVRQEIYSNYYRIIDKLNNIDDSKLGYLRICNLMLLDTDSNNLEIVQLLKDKLMKKTQINDYRDLLKLKDLIIKLPIQFKIYYKGRWRNKKFFNENNYMELVENQINLLVNDIYSKIKLVGLTPEQVFIKYYCLLYYWKSRDGIYSYMIQKIIEFTKNLNLEWKITNVMTKNVIYNLLGFKLQNFEYNELASKIDKMRYQETFKIKKDNLDYQGLIIKNKFEDILSTAQIFINGEDITPIANAVFYDSVIPNRKYKNSVGNGIYCYSWEIKKTNSYQPMGNVNLSKIGNFEIKCIVNTETDLIIYKNVEGINILRYISGLCGKAWVI